MNENIDENFELNSKQFKRNAYSCVENIIKEPFESNEVSINGGDNLNDDSAIGRIISVWNVDAPSNDEELK